VATYVSSPPTQSGVADTKTSITKTFTFYGSGGFVQVDYEVNSEAFFDLFKIIINGVTVWTDSDVGNGPQMAQLATTAGSQTLRLQYEKDGGGDAGSDNVVVTEIRIYNGSSVLQETHNFSGTNGTGPPTGWTEILNDGGVAVTGSHWTLTDTGGGDVTLTPALHTNTQTFFAPTIGLVLEPGLLTNSQTFFSPTITPSDDLAPSLHANSQSFFPPTIGLELTPSLFTNSQTFFTPTVDAQFRAPDCADVLLRNNGLCRPAIRGDNLRAALKGDDSRPAIRGDNDFAQLRASLHTAHISEG
jgi:hypothetical protein